MQLIDMYKKEFNSDLLALTNIGKRISGKRRLRIDFGSSRRAVFTDGKIIFIPSKFRNDIKTAQGFVSHEAGHIGYGSFEIAFKTLVGKLSEKFNVPPNFVKHIINIVEDVRINSINKIKFPGFYNNLREFTKTLLPKIKARIEKYDDIFLYLNLFLEDFKGFRKKPKDFKKIRIRNEDWNEIKALKKFILATQSPNSSIIVCNQLCEILSRYFIFRKPKEHDEINHPKYGSNGRLKRGSKTNIRQVELDANYSRNGNVFTIEDEDLVFNHFEEFTNFEDEKSKTALEKKSEELIKGLVGTSIIIEDIEKLTELYEKRRLIEKEEENLKSIDEIIKRVERFDEFSENKQKVQDTKEEIINDLKGYCKHEEIKMQNKVKKLTKEVNEVKKLIDDIKHLNKSSTKEEKQMIKTRLESALKKENRDALDDLEKFSEFFDNIEESNQNETGENQEKQRDDILAKLNKIKDKKESIVQKKIRKYNKEKKDFESLIKDIDEFTNARLNKSNRKNEDNDQKENLLKNLRKFRHRVRSKRDLEVNMEEKNLSEIVKFLDQSEKEIKERLLAIGTGMWLLGQSNDSMDRKVIDAQIENEKMIPIQTSYSEIRNKYKNIITKMKLIFKDLTNNRSIDTYQKMGRLNKNYIKAVTSSYKFKKCFTKKIKKKILKILLMVDISGSMKGKKLKVAKTAMVMLCESLANIAQIRLILFSGQTDAINILIKDFKDKIDSNKFDRFGLHHQKQSNLDGLSIKHESSKLHGDEIIIVISDGQPAGTRYNLQDAIPQIQEVRKKYNIFAFSIDARGDYLDKLYGKNWITVSSTKEAELGEKIVNFCKFIVKEYFH